MRNLLSLVAYVLASVVAYAEDPQATIASVSPEAEVGDLIVVDGSESVGSGHKWRVDGIPKTQWIPIDGGRKIVLAAKSPCSIKITLTVGCVSEDAKAVLLSDSQVEIAVAGGDDEGGHTPDPKPGVDGKFGILKVIRDNSGLVSGEKQLAVTIAANYRRVGELAKAGKLDVKSGSKVDVGATINVMSTAVGAANATLPESARPAWRPILLKVNEQVELIANAKESVVKTVGDAGDLFVEIAEGLAKVK